MKAFKMLFGAEQIRLIPYLAKWTSIAGLVSVLAGSASALFLVSLDKVTQWRESHLWAIALLPLSGFVVGWVYDKVGRSVDAGNNLLIDEVHDPRKVIPLRMAPLVLLGTLVSHMFGASVGREGSAVQMGGALADQLTHVFRLKAPDRSIVLMTGMSAGFAAVFGTPLAGAIFGLEVLAIGRMKYDALFPCMISGIIANQICLAFGVHHTHYAISAIDPVSVTSIFIMAIAGIVFGLAGFAFAGAVHSLGALSKRLIKYGPMRPFVGGIIVAVAAWALGTYQYLGLGIPDIMRSFQEPMSLQDPLGKFFFTVTSLGSGFKGGEVTPLFYIGATLGNAIAPFTGLPFPMMAAVGFVAVFAGAANTPLTTTIMAIELFGAPIAPFAAVACITAYLFSGSVGIYRAQRKGDGKHPHPLGIKDGEQP